MTRTERASVEPFFVAGGSGSCFCLLRRPPPQCPTRGVLVYLHPFAEEMNKSRRTVALAARRLASTGWATLQIDLMGCGDSDGELRDADWAAWRDDASCAIEYARSEFAVPVGLWGLRLGALLACDIAHDDASLDGPVVLWNPVTSGKTFLTQFLRIAVAGAAFGREVAAGSTAELASRLAAGEVLEIGGYEIGSALAADLSHLELAQRCPASRKVIWCETSTMEPASLSPSARAIVERWRAEGCDVSVVSILGEPFWVSLEIAEGHALVAATASVLNEQVPA